jgi:hypothetical protein
MRSLPSVVVAILLASCTLQVAVPARAADAVAWTQYGLGESPPLIARALVDRTDACPVVEWDGSAEQMTVRDPLRVPAFGKLCESRKPLPESLKVRVRLGETLLLDQQITRRPERIAVIGDTGCRITFYYDQGCDDPNKWPFATIAPSVADKHPDLILHLGDYYYREVPCLGAATKCPPGPYGDGEPAWRADFFEPARPLLAKAPWVFGRGNHENCDRGGYGWAYYFGDDAVACDTTHTTAFVRLNGLMVVNFDTASTGNRYLAKDMNNNWANVAQVLRAQPPATPGEPVLLMTHEPGYFVCADKEVRLEPCKASIVAELSGVRAMGDAARQSGRRTIMLSGHIHAFRTIDVSPPGLAGASVTQVVVGTGGANQNEDPTPRAMVVPDVVDTRFYDAGDKNGLPIRVQGWSEFGFGVLSATSLQLTMFDTRGRPQFTCALADEISPPRCR